MRRDIILYRELDGLEMLLVINDKISRERVELQVNDVLGRAARVYQLIRNEHKIHPNDSSRWLIWIEKRTSSKIWMDHLDGAHPMLLTIYLAKVSIVGTDTCDNDSTYKGPYRNYNAVASRNVNFRL
ncbi:hypothetical protein YC2023_062192 [Brassica napus]